MDSSYLQSPQGSLQLTLYFHLYLVVETQSEPEHNKFKLIHIKNANKPSQLPISHRINLLSAQGIYLQRLRNALFRYYFYEVSVHSAVFCMIIRYYSLSFTECNHETQYNWFCCGLWPWSMLFAVADLRGTLSPTFLESTFTTISFSFSRVHF